MNLDGWGSSAHLFRIKSPSGKRIQACIYWFPASQTDQIRASPPFRLFVEPIASGPNLHSEGGKDAPWLGQHVEIAPV